MALTIAPFYTVQHSVGRGVGGSKTDVMLVQYMLWHICVQGAPHFTKRAHPPFMPIGGKPDALFPHTGTYTPGLDLWIAGFQQASLERGWGNLTVDGKVSATKIGWGPKSKVGDFLYTIQVMNHLMWRMCERPYGELPLLSDVPGELKTALTLNTFIDAP